MTRGPARRRAVLRAVGIAPLAIVCLLVLSLFLVSPVVKAQTPGVTVINVPPEFQDIGVGAQGGLHHIDVIISDDNSWGDILRVDLEILDESDNLVAHVILQTYLSNASLIWEPTFMDNVGQNLVRADSLAIVNTNPQTVEDRSELRVTFAITPLVGRWVRVTATDLDGLNATVQVEYLEGFLGEPSLFPPWLLLLLAVAASVVLVGTRIRREIRGR